MRKLMRDIKLKPREVGNLPPEKLLGILRDIYPKETADELFTDLMSLRREERK